MEEIVRCSFDINRTEYFILLFLLRKNSEFTVSEIAKFLNRERTTVQKAIKRMVKKDLVFRRQVNLEQGGYMYYYSVKNKKKIKKQILDLIDSWSESAKKAVKRW